MAGYEKNTLFFNSSSSINKCIYPHAEVFWTFGLPENQRLEQLQTAAKRLEEGCLDKQRRKTNLLRFLLLCRLNL
jgi:hypothetical protein